MTQSCDDEDEAASVFCADTWKCMGRSLTSKRCTQGTHSWAQTGVRIPMMRGYVMGIADYDATDRCVCIKCVWGVREDLIFTHIPKVIAPSDDFNMHTHKCTKKGGFPFFSPSMCWGKKSTVHFPFSSLGGLQSKIKVQGGDSSLQKPQEISDSLHLGSFQHIKWSIGI